MKTLLKSTLRTVLFLTVLSVCSSNVWAQYWPIYYRIGISEDLGDFSDKPRALEFIGLNNPYQKLYENSLENKQDSIGNRLSFLGSKNSAMEGGSTNYAFFVDTAYVNRGLGLLKPQYMLAVDTFIANDIFAVDNEWWGNRYLIGRYLYNAAMYAKSGESSGRTNFNKVQTIDQLKIRNPNGDAYLHNPLWERLAFAWAIHKGDSLYVLKGVDLEPRYKNADDDPYQLWLTLSKEYGVEGQYVDFDKLINENIIPGSEYQEEYFREGSDGNSEMRTYYDFKPATALSPGKTIGLHAIIALDDNTHKDWVFSFRIVSQEDEPIVFVIESETTNRDIQNGSIILPEYGGWVGLQNGVPVIVRGDESTINDGGAFAFRAIQAETPAVSNKVISYDASTTVIGGAGNVTILNAANKNVIISDILGRIISNSIAFSDNISIAAPSGIIFVSIGGEKATKVIVK